MGYVFLLLYKKLGGGYKVYLNTESKAYRNQKIETTTFGMFVNGDGNAWSGRLKAHLKKIPEKYVFIILDDFFLTEKVDDEEFRKCIRRMEEDEKISVFLFDQTPGPNFPSEFERFERKGQTAPYRFCLQAGLWRREYLIRYLRDHEGPWQFESWGSIRSRRYIEKFYCLKPGAKRIFTYPNGGVLCDGKWNGDEVCSMIRGEFGNVDFTKRGIYHRGDARVWSIGKRSFLNKAIGVIKSLV